MKEKKTILVAMKYCTQLDDIVETLKRNNFNLLIANMAKAVTSILDHNHPNLLLADIDLPGQDGLALIRNLRKTYEAPIIMLSQNYDENIVVSALDAGANDVLILPFGRAEHLARIRAALRCGCSGQRGVSGGVFTTGALTIDYDRRLVTSHNKLVHLTPIEFRIITLLTRNAGKVLTHDEIIDDIWGPYNSDNLVLRVNMANIRRKIEVNPAEPQYIVTEVGVGYRVVCE
ncbi:MAG: response regulator transcription factor [Defluviitaleaceae bacterium]|nr:response regulator transcription factor [Defluviitaleaceae bacterium]